MEVLFGENIILLFFFSMIAIFNYSNLQEYQRISIMYITVFSLLILDTISIQLALLFISIALFSYLEILTKDDTKFRILVSPLYKVIDFIYLSITQYAFIYILLSFLLYTFSTESILDILFKSVSIALFIKGITLTLQQKFIVCSFNEMYKIFSEFPINKVKFNNKLHIANTILVNIEDKRYYDRKGYTFLSFDYIYKILKERIMLPGFIQRIKILYSSSKVFLSNTLNEKRGYSTIPMQLIRSLGIKRGYNYTYRRKVFELLYSKMFFKGIENMLEDDNVANREKIKDYYLYIYYHTVNTFLGDAIFTKFLNAFDMQYASRNNKDIYDCSKEGIFIACMGLSKRTDKINESTIDSYMSIIKSKHSVR